MVDADCPGSEADKVEERVKMEEWINDRMTRFVQSDGSVKTSESILLQGMTEYEVRAFCLGVRAGKHSAAIEVIRGIRSPIGDEIAKKIDPFMELG